MVTMSSPAVSRTLLPMTSKAEKLLETEPVACDNKFNVIPGHQTFIVPYSTDNRSKEGDLLSAKPLT